jgi:hypothetical protein
VGGRPSVLRVLLAVVTTAALVAAAWLVVLGRRQSNRASALRGANTAAIARNRMLNSRKSAIAAATTRAQARIDLVNGDGQSTVASLDTVVGAWNKWLAANNAMIESANRFVDQGTPPGPAIRTALDPRVRDVSNEEAALQVALMKFASAVAKARHDVGAGKP